ncbi:ATP-dependent DNA helicase [Betaproteobacteria bacterium SCGC AG-212-J23]|nr:ATP-dependent DNA helicase [Betaproteobacteria bacterium SCGC AG-212-J23]
MLNTRQKEAATFGHGPLLILAGAGTGKTNTLAHRVAHLLLSGTAPERILLLTFSRRAAQEMTRRAQRIVAESVKEVRLPWSGTFHAIGNRLIRSHAQRVGLAPGFTVLDRGDAADLVDVLRHELGLSKTEKRFPRKDTCLAIYSHRVNTQGSLADTLQSVFPWCAEWEEPLARLFRLYVERKSSIQALDYDDLLLYWRAMMEDEALAAEIGELFDHVLVDEYQDTNVLQGEILARLRPGGQGLTVVGDDAQAIYSFRAATVENIRSFPDRFGASVVSLEDNYRSTQPILDAANALVGKSLVSRKGAGEKPRYVTVADDAAQASYVVTKVLENREKSIPLRRQSVLFRSSHHSDVLELELVRRNIPYVKYGGLKFLEAAHVKDLLAVLRWADNPKNRVAAWRTLQLLPGVGPATAASCFTRFETSGWEALSPLDAGLSGLLESVTVPEAPWAGQVARVREWYAPHLERLYEEAQVRAGDLEQLEKISAQFDSRERFLTELALDPPSATGDLSGAPHLDEDYLVLSTVHSAKGQEWDAVYVLNVADGNFPSEFATGRADLIEEERRLLYVAMTRAKTSLDLLAPVKYFVTQQSRMGDRHVYGAKSRFLTGEVMKHLEAIAWSDETTTRHRHSRGTNVVDVAAKLRSMW